MEDIEHTPYLITFCGSCGFRTRNFRAQVMGLAANQTVDIRPYTQSRQNFFGSMLTVIGQFARAIIARKIENSNFEIRTSVPNVEVSWQVTGVRQDA